MRVRLPRLLIDSVRGGIDVSAQGSTVEEVLADLFRVEPGLRHHLLDETGGLRQHVTVFVNGVQSGLASDVADGAEIRVLQAVSGG